MSHSDNLTTIARSTEPGALVVGNAGDVLECQGGQLWKPKPPSGGGAVNPIPQAVVVDPNRVGPPPGDGSWDGKNTFRTLQAAYNSLASDAVATIWLVPSPTSVGALVMGAGNTQRLTIRGMGDKQGAGSFVTSIEINNGCQSLSLHDLIVTGDITQQGGEGNFNGPLTLYGVEAQGAITLPQSELVTLDWTAINGPGTTQVLDWFSQNLRNGSPNVILTDALVTWDAVSEHSYFQGLGNTTLANATTIDRSDDGAPSGTVGPDSAFTFTDAAQRAVATPGRLTLNRIWKLSHVDSKASGFVVDIWQQTVDLTITDDGDATLYTYTAADLPVRLTFFAAAGGNFVLTGKQLLAEL